MTLRPRRRRVHLSATAILLLVLLLLPGAVAAHAELDEPTPADGATVEGTPTAVAGTFTQDIDPDGSSLRLRDAAGETIAEGGVDPADDRRMVITDLPDLAPGEYTVRWTTHSAEDDEIARGTWRFTVVAAPTPEPTPAPTPTPSATASVEPTAAPTPTPASPSPTPSAPPDQEPTATGADVLLPIVLGLAIIGFGAGYLLARRRGSR
jgi:methionine-rich copper-binding protein CopC